MGEAMGSIVGAVFCGNDEERLAEWAKHQEREKQKMESEQRILSERCILLKAKLVEIRQSLCADRLFTEVPGNDRN